MRRIRRLLQLAGLSLAAAGCAANAIHLAPTAPDEPWTPNPDTQTLSILPAPPSTTSPPPTNRPADFSIPVNEQLGNMSDTVAIDKNRRYGLAELIDIAQRSNPDTRASWERARQAALAVGMAEATYLPLITANAIAGHQDTSTALSTPSGQATSVDASLEGSASFLALQWLVFDFGQRQALADVARQNSFAANVTFNGSHQRLIFDVTRAYYQYGNAVDALSIARQTLRDSESIRDAAQGRLDKGLATTVEVAQARQRVMQSKLRRVTAEGQVRDAYQTLLSAMGISATLNVGINDSHGRNLPSKIEGRIEPIVRAALARRPDVAASYAAVRATKAGIVATEANFMPKVYVSGAVATGTGGFNVDGLPGIGNQTSSTGILIGASVPLYDGGMREAQLKRAQSQAIAAEQDLRKTQINATAEIVSAANTLRTMLDSYATATDLKAAAALTYDSAFSAYKDGAGTLTAALQADSDLLEARLAQTNAKAASMIASANLAFVIGALTSSR